jgi:hypothetical protein
MNSPRLPFFSVVICSIDALKFTQASARYEQLLADFPHEIIGIHDARSLAGGYNRALRRARGEFMIFSHDDILILDQDFAQKINCRLRDFDILGFTGTRCVVSENWWQAGLSCSFGVVAHTYEDGKLGLSIWNIDPWPVVGDIQGIDGLCIMARREVAEEIGFDEATFDGFHLYDLDFSFSAYRAGKKLGVCCDIPVIHGSVGSYGNEHTRYGRLFIEKHKDALPIDVPIVGKSEGEAMLASDYRDVCAMWQEDIFRRSLIADQRKRKDGLGGGTGASIG